MSTLKHRLLDLYPYMPVYSYSVTPLRVRLKALELAYAVRHAPRPRMPPMFILPNDLPEITVRFLRERLTQHSTWLNFDWPLFHRLVAVQNQAHVVAVSTAMKRLIAALHAALPSLLAALSPWLRPRHYSFSSFRFTRRGYRGHSVAKRRRGVNG